MSDNVTDTIANGAEGVAASTASQQQDSSNKDATAQAFSDSQLKQIGEIVKTAVQSTKDVRFQRLENETNETKKQLSGVSETIARLKEYQQKFGITEAQAIREMERDDEIAALRREPVSAGGQQASSPNLSALASSIVTGAGLDANSEGVRAWMATLVDTDPVAVARSAAQFVAAQLQKPQPSAADVVQDPARKTGGNLQSSYDAEMVDYRKNNLRPNPMAIKAIKDKYRKQGLEI